MKRGLAVLSAVSSSPYVIPNMSVLSGVQHGCVSKTAGGTAKGRHVCQFFRHFKDEGAEKGKRKPTSSPSGIPSLKRGTEQNCTFQKMKPQRSSLCSESSAFLSVVIHKEDIYLLSPVGIEAKIYLSLGVMR